MITIAKCPILVYMHMRKPYTDTIIEIAMQAKMLGTQLFGYAFKTSPTVHSQYRLLVIDIKYCTKNLLRQTTTGEMCLLN